MIDLHILTAAESQALKFGAENWTRASGFAICASCKRLYISHPTPVEVYELMNETAPKRWGWLRRLCDGRFVKP